MTTDHVRTHHLVFTGKTTDIFSAEFLKSLGWAATIVGLPVAILIWCRWWIRHIVLTDGTTFIFSGTLKQSFLLTLLAILAGLPQEIARAIGISGVVDRSLGPALLVALPALVSLYLLGGFILPALVQREFLKWWCDDTQPITGAGITFVGRPWPFIGWNVAHVLSIFTIIGWAWVFRAYAQWVCTNITSAGRSFRFTGSGAEILWRGSVTFAACCGIVTLPWALVWFARWFYRNITVEIPQDSANPTENVSIHMAASPTPVTDACSTFLSTGIPNKI